MGSFVIMPKKYKEKEFNRHAKIAAKQMTRPRLACATEVQVLLTCMKKHGFDGLNTKCQRDAKKLSTCISSLGSEKKQKDTLNYHLQRLSRFMKRR